MWFSCSLGPDRVVPESLDEPEQTSFLGSFGIVVLVEPPTVKSGINDRSDKVRVKAERFK
jgi:hypothetical protein